MQKRRCPRSPIRNRHGRQHQALRAIGAKSVGGSLGGKGLTFVAGSVAEPDFCHPTMGRQWQECANSGHSRRVAGERVTSRSGSSPLFNVRPPSTQRRPHRDREDPSRPWRRIAQENPVYWNMARAAKKNPAPRGLRRGALRRTGFWDRPLGARAVEFQGEGAWRRKVGRPKAAS
jgi:hypothetical protein